MSFAEYAARLDSLLEPPLSMSLKRVMYARYVDVGVLCGLSLGSDEVEFDPPVHCELETDHHGPHVHLGVAFKSGASE